MVPNALNLEPIIRELQNATEFQTTIREFEYLDYLRIVHNAIRQLYVDTGRALEYSEDLFIVDDEHKHWFNKKTEIDEVEYIIICSKLSFYDMVSKEYIDMISFTTNALTVSSAGNPYKNFKELIYDLQKRRREVYYGMSRFWGGVTDEV